MGPGPDRDRMRLRYRWERLYVEDGLVEISDATLHLLPPLGLLLTSI